jgi:glycosyltransferase involved in cell wall biosynthesis
MPKLSVLLPVYNGVDNYPRVALRSSIESILGLGADLELIVVDDGSTDNTFNILMEFWEKHNKVRVINLTTNQGQAAALNVGLENAKGQYIWQWSVRAQAQAEAVELVELLDNNPDVGFVYGAMRSWGGEKEYTHRPPHIFSRKRFIERYLCNFYMFRRIPGLKYVEQLKLGNRTIGICDRDMVMQLMDKGATGMGLHDVMCVSYYNGGEHTMDKIVKYRPTVERLFKTRWERML